MIRAFEQTGHDGYQELCQQWDAGEGDNSSGDEGMGLSAQGAFCTLDLHLVTDTIHRIVETAGVGTVAVQPAFMAIRAFPGIVSEELVA
nr:hypothetical protein [Faecalibaculum rodentium]